MFFKAFSAPLRLRILTLLVDKPMSVYDLLGELEVPQPTLSGHLARLRALGLVHSVADGPWRRYSINPEFEDLLVSAAGLADRWDAKVLKKACAAPRRASAA